MPRSAGVAVAHGTFTEVPEASKERTGELMLSPEQGASNLTS
jgi:hypothetical protein